MIDVLLVDDHPVVRSGLRAILDAQPDMRVVAEAATGDEGVRLAGETHPDVAVVDLQLPDISGIEVIDRLAQLRPKPKILVFSVHHAMSMVRSALRAGAGGFIGKDSGLDEVGEGIRTVVEGKKYFGESILSLIREDFCTRVDPAPGSLATSITPREQQVMEDLANNLTVKEIAVRRSISVATVRTHIRKAKGKTNSRTLAGLIRFGVQNGLLPGTITRS